MSNKQSLKKLIFIVVFATACLGTIMVYVSNKYMENYNRINNEKLEAVILAVHDKYPELTCNEIMEILEADYNTVDNPGSLFETYGIDASEDALVLSNTSAKKRMVILCVSVFVFEAAVLITIFLLYEHRRYKEIYDITKCIENINHKIYHMDIDSNTEDELSILKNEIYKTTIMLKEDAENSKLAKKLLKDSLSDISHQLKTPLTSITIMLDNLYDNPDMDARARQRFLRDMRREISNINFMVQSLLKLSKLDANTVEFKNEKVSLSELVRESVKNIAALSDLKNVDINISGNDYIICCDRRWQIEAISNILKNSVEHSDEGSTVDINMDDNHVFTKLTITNYGGEISENDKAHLFERFFRGANATAESVGIGLALAKSIVEGCGGAITVDSSNGKTTFSIIYYK